MRKRGEGGCANELGEITFHLHACVLKRTTSEQKPLVCVCVCVHSENVPT